MSNGRSPIITPFSNIAVWSAVKFVVSAEEGGAAFLPLITDPENIDKSSLFKPLRYIYLYFFVRPHENEGEINEGSMSHECVIHESRISDG